MVLSPHIAPHRLQTLEILAKDFQLDESDLLALIEDGGLELISYRLGSLDLITARPAEVAGLLELELHDLPFHLLTAAARRERLAGDVIGTASDTAPNTIDT